MTTLQIGADGMNGGRIAPITALGDAAYVYRTADARIARLRRTLDQRPWARGVGPTHRFPGANQPAATPPTRA